jgi:hypothetical protein
MSMICDAGDKRDLDINALISERLIGVARADTASLEFIKGREIDARIIDGLVRVFRKTKCRRHDPDHHIPVVINQGDLSKTLEASGLTQEALATPAKDGSPHFVRAVGAQKFLCLHGRHRIEAAQKFLPDDDQWWTIKLVLVISQGIS